MRDDDDVREVMANVVVSGGMRVSGVEGTGGGVGGPGWRVSGVCEIERARRVEEDMAKRHVWCQEMRAIKNVKEKKLYMEKKKAGNHVARGKRSRRRMA